MHKLLSRQIKKILRDYPRDETLQRFVDAVDQAYGQADTDRKLLERSLDLTSKELSERNRQLHQRLEQLESTHRDLENSMATLRATFDSTGEAIFSIDTVHARVQCNRLAKKILGLPAGQDNLSLFDFLRRFVAGLERPCEARGIIEQQFMPEQRRGSCFALQLADGAVHEIYSSPKMQRTKEVGLVLCVRDVTDFKKNQDLIRHQAYHDALTDLPNRLLLKDRVEHAIALARRNSQAIAILFIDLDHFKKINDSVGHHVGDEVLIQASHRIKDCLRAQDTLARIGGDEFVIMAEDIDSILSMNHLAKRIIDNVKKPILFQDNEYYIGCSIGISFFPRDGNDFDELLRKADISMYHAKKLGRSNFQYFNEALEKEAVEQLYIENNLRHAISRDELHVYYQPKVNLVTRKIDSVEALLRWKHNGRMIPPDVFIPIAEQSGIIQEISRWVFTQSCRDLKSWSLLAPQPPIVAVNISSMMINDASFIGDVKNIMAVLEIPGKWLEFEITESALLQDNGNAVKLIDEIKNIDISLTIDDFGTGYSSLSYLHKLPIDNLKIDKSFILKLTENDNDQTITRTILDLCKNLGLTVIAEGVESEEASNWLASQRCDYAQGFYFFEPMPAERFAELLGSEADSSQSAPASRPLAHQA